MDELCKQFIHTYSQLGTTDFKMDDIIFDGFPIRMNYRAKLKAVYYRVGVFLTAIWLPYSKLWATAEGSVSLTRTS